MRRITVGGRLGADAKIETSKNGRQYLSFRLAGGEPGEPETMWFTVHSFDSFVIEKLSPYLKKGSSVEVIGRYRDSIYTKKDGTPDISREIRAVDICFPDFAGKKEGDGNGTNRTGQQQTNENAYRQQPAAQQYSQTQQHLQPQPVQQPIQQQVQYQQSYQQPAQPVYVPQQQAYTPQNQVPYGGQGPDADLPF